MLRQDLANALTDLGMVGRNAQVLQVQQRVVGRDPLGLVEAPAPVAVGMASGQELRAPALDCNALPQVGAFLFQQVAVDLVLDGDIARQQPVDETRLGSNAVSCHPPCRLGGSLRAETPVHPV